MPPEMYCLLFVDPVKVPVSNEGTFTVASRRNGYALMFSSEPWEEISSIALTKAFTECGLEIIGSDQSQASPSPETKFEALEIRINIDRRTGDRAELFFLVYCKPCNFVSIHRLFKCSRQVTVHNDFKPSLSRIFKDANIYSDNLLLAQKLLASRPDMPFRDEKGGNLIHFAVRRGQRLLFERLLDFGAKIDLKNNEGETPLLLAVGNNEMTPSQYQLPKIFTIALLSKGADIFGKTLSGYTSLHMAVEVGRWSVVDLLLKNGATALVNVSAKDGKTPLHVAVAAGSHGRIVKVLLQHGADVHALDREGMPPLLHVGRSISTLKTLIEHGASVDFQTDNNRTVLLLAMERGWRESVEYILSLRPNPNLAGNREALYVALLKENKIYDSVVARMLQDGFTIDPTDLANRPTVVAGAVHKGLVEDVRNLLDNGAAVNEIIPFHSLNNMTLLFVAIRTKNADMVRLLINRGADVNFVRPCDHPGGQLAKTPVVSAVEHATLEILKLLFEAGAGDRAEQRLLLLAVEKNQPDIVDFLLQEGFDLNSGNVDGRQGRTFVSIALCKGHSDVIDVLTSYGAKCAYSDLPQYNMIPLSHTRIMHHGHLTGAVFEKFLNLCPPKLTSSDESTLLKVFKDDVYLRSPRMHGQLLASHMVKMEVLNPKVKFTAFIPPMYNNGLVHFKESCEVEIERMNVKIPNTYVTYQDILTKDDCRVARYARNLKVVKAMTSASLETRFPIYSGILISKFKLGVWYNTLLQKAAPVLRLFTRQFSPLFIPDDIIEMIIRTLSYQDLIILARCVPVQQSSE